MALNILRMSSDKRCAVLIDGSNFYYKLKEELENLAVKRTKKGL
ncbi:NYN domain-containing protein [Candidatus Shapirobacteria bacterium]|nr:NYN domain-containing protein [Candidatus Shapirobacteria bacterium]